MINNLNLQKKHNLSKSVSLQEDSSGFEFVIIEHDSFNAAFSLHGGHLLHFQLTEQQPIIWLSKTALFNDQKAIRGGVPICWPWFGEADKSIGDNLPAHGFARTCKWSIKNITELSDGVEVELLLKDSEKTREIWPYQFELTLKATLTDRLKLALITKNTGSKSFTYHAALHTYLNISAANSCLVSGLSPIYSDKLDAGLIKTRETQLLLNGPIDSIYHKSPNKVVLTDKQFNRQISIKNSGNDSEVVWTPWIDGAQKLIDMPDDSYQNMLCIESAITCIEGKKVAAEQLDSLSTEICMADYYA